MRAKELENLKTEIRTKMGALKQTVSLIEEPKNLVKLKNKEMKRRIRNLPSENPFALKDYVQNAKRRKLDRTLFIFLFIRKK